MIAALLQLERGNAVLGSRFAKDFDSRRDNHAKRGGNKAERHPHGDKGEGGDSEDVANDAVQYDMSYVGSEGSSSWSEASACDDERTTANSDTDTGVTRILEILRTLDLGYFESGLLVAVPEAHKAKLWEVLRNLLTEKSSGMIIKDKIEIPVGYLYYASEDTSTQIVATDWLATWASTAKIKLEKDVFLTANVKDVVWFLRQNQYTVTLHTKSKSIPSTTTKRMNSNAYMPK
jgi:hypothetical protein